jgi:protein TonB
MSPSDRPVFDLPEFTALQVRLAVALVLSFTVHLSLIYLLPVRPPSHALPVSALQVTLEEGRLAATRQVAEVPPVLVATREEAPATVLKPRQQAASTLPDVDLAKPIAPPDIAETLPAPAAAPALALEVPLAEDPVYYSAKELDRHPAAARPIVPDYPQEAVRDGVEGSVTLRLAIDEKGALREVAVVDADPPGVFEAVALAAFRAGHFLPGERAGRAVKSRILIKVRWEQGQARQ